MAESVQRLAVHCQDLVAFLKRIDDLGILSLSFALTLIEFAVMAGLTSGQDGLDKDANVALC